MYLSLFSYFNSSLTKRFFSSVSQGHPITCTVCVSLLVLCYGSGVNYGQILNTFFLRKKGKYFLNILNDNHIELIFMKFTKCSNIRVSNSGSVIEWNIFDIIMTFWISNWLVMWENLSAVKRVWFYDNIFLILNTGTKYVRFMKQTAFWRVKNGEYVPCLKYSVPIFVE